MVEVVYIKAPKEELEKTFPEDVSVVCQNLSRWLRIARPGDKYCYYIGEHIAGQRVGRIALNAYEEGEADLFQKKDGYRYEYWAQKKARIY